MVKFKHKPAHIPDFASVASKVTLAARKAAAAHVRAFAAEEAESFRQRIRDQQFPSFDARPLSPAYAARKRALKLDPRTMIATGHYVKHILVQERDKGAGKLLVFIGFDGQEHAVDHEGKDTGITLDLIAKVQEKGSAAANVPARPHWSDHLKGMRTRAKKVREAIRKDIVQRLKGGK